MKIGIDSYCYHRYFGEIYSGQKDPGIRWDLKAFLKHISGMPLEALALETCFLPSQEKEILACVSSLDLDVTFAWGHPDGFMGTNEAESLSDIKKYMMVSKEVGSHVMRITGSSISYFSKPHRPQIELSVKCLKKLVPLAETLSIKLAIENHGDFFLHELLEIVERIDSPFLGITLDTGNCLRLKENPVDAIRLFKERIFIIHAKDLAPIEEQITDEPLTLACVPAGQGITDFKGIVHELHRFHFTGNILIEISRLHPDFENLGETSVIEMGLAHLLTLRREGVETYGARR